MCVEGVLNSAQFARISPLSVLFVGLSVVTRIRTVGEGDIWTLLGGGGMRAQSSSFTCPAFCNLKTSLFAPLGSTEAKGRRQFTLG